MADREKVVKAIEGCINEGSFCNKCDYDGCVFQHGSCVKDLLDDALALLKEQEAVKPTWGRGKPFCGACGLQIRGGKFCSECGKPILWEGR